METSEFLRYRDEFYPGGFRKVFALMLVVAVTVLPEAFAWATAPIEHPGATGIPTGRFRPGGGFLPERETPRSGLLQTFWKVVSRGFVVFVATFGFMLYYPRRGFKRYGLLCGPLTAFVVPWCVSSYLQGRTEVFRAEVLVVALAALSPGVGLYIFLTWRKARRLGMEW